MELGLKGKRAVVLASSRGLGYACAEGLAREGCQVVISSRSQAHVDQAAAQIRSRTAAEVLAVEADVSNHEGIQTVVEACVREFGGVDIAVHNAGGPPSGKFSDISEGQWRASFDQNLMSFVWLVQAVVPEMKKGGYGRILTIASSSIREPIPNLVLSNAMRTGVYGTAKTLAKELAADGILVNVIAPGRIATERIDELDQAAASRRGVGVEQIRAESVGTIPLGRLGRPEELANLTVFLASEAASYITGQAIFVDGGKLGAL